VKEVEVTITPKLAALDTVTVRPGDKLIVRVRSDFTHQDFDEFTNRIREKLPDVEVLVMGAEQILVYREDPPDQSARAIADAVAEATANPGRTVTVKDVGA
jgi:hypothetical protein